MKVIVNPDLCVGNGVCEAVAPDLFLVSDSGEAQPLVDEIPPEAVQLATEAVQGCPARALTLEP